MTTKIIVDPARLDQSAIAMNIQNQEYESQYRLLFQKVEQMQTVWKGKDNQAYTNAIQSFHQDFQKMYTLMEQYANFLKMSAKAYRTTQEERMQQARSLLR